MADHETDPAPAVPAEATDDVAIGTRLRERRIELGMSQQQVARKISCTYQQLHKYERGLNRVSAPTLRTLCRLYKISADQVLGLSGRRALPEDEGGDRSTLETVRLMRGLPEHHRTVVRQLVRGLSQQPVVEQLAVAALGEPAASLAG